MAKTDMRFVGTKSRLLLTKLTFICGHAVTKLFFGFQIWLRGHDLYYFVHKYLLSSQYRVKWLRG